MISDLLQDIEERIQAITGAQNVYPPEIASSKPGWPCIQLEDVEKRLPRCLDPHPEIILTQKHCLDAYTKGEAIIREFAKPISLTGTRVMPERWDRFPPFGLCFFNCDGGKEQQVKLAVHPGEETVW